MDQCCIYSFFLNVYEYKIIINLYITMATRLEVVSFFTCRYNFNTFSIIIVNYIVCNNIYDLKFTMEYSLNTLSFLDNLVKVEDNNISTHIFLSLQILTII